MNDHWVFFLQGKIFSNKLIFYCFKHRFYLVFRSYPRNEFMGQPAIPDPVLMPYPSRASRSPYPGPQVRFEPPSLDFSDVPLGQEVKRTVKIYNLDDKTPLEIKVNNKK